MTKTLQAVVTIDVSDLKYWADANDYAQRVLARHERVVSVQVLDPGYKCQPVPDDCCTRCRGMGSDPVMGSDVPCGGCGGSGKVRGGN